MRKRLELRPYLHPIGCGIALLTSVAFWAVIIYVGQELYDYVVLQQY